MEGFQLEAQNIYGHRLAGVDMHIEGKKTNRARAKKWPTKNHELRGTLARGPVLGNTAARDNAGRRPGQERRGRRAGGCVGGQKEMPR